MLKRYILKFAVNNKVLIKKVIPKKLIDIIGKIVLKNNVKFNRTTYKDASGTFGVNYIGYLNTLSGLGQAARLNCNAIKNLGIPITYHDIYLGSDTNYLSEKYENGLFDHNINIIHVLPGDDFEIMLSQIGKKSLNNKYNIAYWVFELSDIPEKWVSYIKYVNEIWTCSEFSAEAFRKVSDVPVYVVPHSANPIIEHKRSKEYFGLPEKFCFLMMFDSKSSMERKNPYAVIKAYKSKFSDSDDTCLVIKMNNSDKYQLDLLKNELKDVKNYRLIDKKLSSNDVYSLISLCDVLVSLHRSEGFGLVMLEAMMLGVPSVATNYSGNVDFMNSETSCLVNYKLVKTVNNSLNPNKVYGEGKYWADPDPIEAGNYMFKLFNDKKFYKKLSSESIKFSKDNFSMKNLEKNILDRINCIKK